MKHWYNFLCLLLLSTFASYGQNVYPYFSELNGIEDYNGNTNLLYRIWSKNQDSLSSSGSNSIYLFNVVNKSDSVFQQDFNIDSYYTGIEGRGISSYDFWEKDPHKFIACGVISGSDPTAIVDRFDNRDRFMPIIGYGSFIRISRQNDSLVYATFNDAQFYRSTDGGNSWDTPGNFNVISLSPYNDKVLFSIGSGMLYKTADGGLTRHAVDVIPLSGYHNDLLFYDKDTNYIYRTGYYYSHSQAYNSFLVSNNSGNENSWQVKFTTDLSAHIYLSIDNSVAGSVYLASGRFIYHSNDFGNTFSLVHTFDRSLVGIYKKPFSTKLYAATYNSIYELDGSSTIIIKQIPVDKGIFRFDPINVGNKWIYKSLKWTPESTVDFIYSKEIIKDTVLADQLIYKQIKYISLDSVNYEISYQYERIDSSNGKVYFWNNISHEAYQCDDLSNTSDTIFVSRFGLLNGPTSCVGSGDNIFGLHTYTNSYSSPVDQSGNRDWYWLSKDFGLTYHFSGRDQAHTIYNLKGAIINGVFYGDTSFVVGITDKYPAHPDNYTLSQNYPNPFNPATTINYSLPKAGNVKLTIYNALGSKVATIVNEYKQPGNYSVQFNSSNYASGIYFYRLESGQFSQIKKMILLK